MTPKLRFPEFTDEWQVKKLGDIFSYEQPAHYLVESAEYDDDHGTPVLTAGKTFVLGYTDEKEGVYNKGLPITLFDDFTTASQWVNFPFKVKSSAAKILKAKSGTHPKIAHELLRRIRFKAEDHQRYWISTFQNFEVQVPGSGEQQKIANFMGGVDQMLTSLSDKVAAMHEYKRGIMQAIFSGKLRFKDENGNPYPDWEMRRLGDFIHDYKLKSSTENEYPVMTSSRAGIVMQKDYYSDNNRITDRDNTGYNVIPNGYLTYRSRSDDGVFKFNLNSTGITGIVSYFYPVFSIKQGNEKFFEELFNYHWRTFYKYSVGTSQRVLAHTELKSIRLFIPAEEEQQKIANFLSAIDRKVELMDAQVAATREYKRALLQRMFV